MSTVAFIGLGHMGRGMAQRVLAAGHTLHVYNRTTARTAPLEARGARIFATPAATCDGVEAIICMVADDEASRNVWCGPSGVFSATPSPNAFAIECSTLSHAWVLELAARSTARGLRYLDAPVTGLPDAAATGALTLLVGADSANLAAGRALLGSFAQRIIHFGAVGSGTAYKLIINLLGAVQIASVAESMAIAERAGLDLRIVADAIASGQAASPQVIRNCQRMVTGQHGDVAFTPRLRLKDVNYALQLSRSLGVGSPFGALAETMFEQLCSTGLADLNESAIFDVARAQPKSA